MGFTCVCECLCVCVSHSSGSLIIVLVSRDDTSGVLRCFQPSANHGEAEAGRANEQLGDAGGRRSEVKLQTVAPQATSSTATQTQQNQSFHPDQSCSQRSPRVSSVLEEAERVLHQVQRQRKILEENLEVLERGRSTELFYSQLDALVDDRLAPTSSAFIIRSG